jgi:hypothetical protein
VLAIAHRTPGRAAEVAALSAAGVSVFEVDVRLIGGELVSTHFRPVLRALPMLQQDNGRFRWGVRDPRAPTLAALRAVLPADAEVLLDLKDDAGPAALALAAQIVRDVPDPAGWHVCSKHWASLRLLSGAGWRTWLTVGSRAGLAAFDRQGLAGAWAVTAKRTVLRDPQVRDRLLAATEGRLMSWTVNDVGEAERLLRGGVRGLTSDSLAVHRLVSGWGAT